MFNYEADSDELITLNDYKFWVNEYGDEESAREQMNYPLSVFTEEFIDMIYDVEEQIDQLL